MAAVFSLLDSGRGVLGEADVKGAARIMGLDDNQVWRLAKSADAEIGIAAFEMALVNAATLNKLSA